MIEVDPHDRGLTLGDGLFETILVKGGKAIWLDDHLQRMGNAAHELGIVFDEDHIRHSISQRQEQNGVLRITLTRGVIETRSLSANGTKPKIIVTFSELKQSAQSITLATSTIRRNETAPSSRMKTLSYIDNIAAAREVVGRGDDALMLNTQSHVACTSIGNLFLLKGDRLITPRADQGILKGITRSKLLPLANEVIVSVEDLLSADAVFRTNSLRLVTQVTAIDGHPVGTKSVQRFLDHLINVSE